MDNFDGRYYKYSKLILEPIGLWPYGTLWKRNVACLVYHFGILSVVIPQIILLAEVWREDIDLMIELIASIFFNLACLCKYQISFFTTSKLKSLLSQMVKDCQGIKDTHERELLIEFYEGGRFMGLLYIAYLMGAWFSLHSVQFAPLILDYVFPLENGTRGKIIVVHGNYFSLDQEDYHYESCIYLSAVNLSLVTMVAGTDSIYVFTTKHVCGLMTVTGHRLNTIGKANGIGTHGFFDDKCVINDIRRAVTLHRGAIRCHLMLFFSDNVKQMNYILLNFMIFLNFSYCIILEDAFAIVFFIHQIFSIIIMALCFFNLIFIPCTYFRMCQCICLGCGMNFYMMFLNWVGQEIIDVSEKLMNTTYCSEWLLISPQKRKLIAFALIRLLHPSQLTTGKLSSLSMTTYGQIVSSTMTYVAALISMSKH